MKNEKIKPANGDDRHVVYLIRDFHHFRPPSMWPKSQPPNESRYIVERAIQFPLFRLNVNDECTEKSFIPFGRATTTHVSMESIARARPRSNYLGGGSSWISSERRTDKPTNLFTMSNSVKERGTPHRWKKIVIA